MTPTPRSAFVRAFWLLGALLCAAATAQTSAPASLSSRLGLPNVTPAVRPYLRPAPPRALTPLLPGLDGWTLPGAVATTEPSILKAGAVVTLASGQVARLGQTELSVQGIQISRDVRWTRIELRLRNLGAKSANLGDLSWRASGDQGSDLATMPGLYDRSGAPVTTLTQGETRELSLWIQLPVEGSGDTALRGGELAATLLIGDGSRAVRLMLPRLR